MITYIEKTTFLGEAALIAGNEELEFILVPSWGSNILSLKEKKRGIQLLHCPQSREEYLAKPVLYGTPVLFPPNRIEDGIFTFNQKKYQFDLNEPERHNHIHGFVSQKPWEVVKKVQIDQQVVLETQFDSAKFKDVQRQFPHHFLLKMRFTLDGTTLYKEATVMNQGEDAFPWGIGYHTTFNFPFQKGEDAEQCLFALTADKKWELNERLLPTETLLDLADRTELQKGVAVRGRSMDDAFLSSVVTGGENRAVLMDPTSQLKLTYQADQNFKHWVVYTNDGYQGYICPEPYTWITNAPNLDLPAELTGVQVLQPGEEKRVSTSITVENSV